MKNPPIDQRTQAPGPPFFVERGADGQSTVVCQIDGRDRHIAFADFIEGERRHALALRRAAIDQALASAGRAARHAARRLRRMTVVAVVGAFRPARRQGPQARPAYDAAVVTVSSHP